MMMIIWNDLKELFYQNFSSEHVIDESELLKLKDLNHCFNVEMNHESTEKCSRRKNRNKSLWKKKNFLSKKERSVHERSNVNDSSMIIIKKNDEYFKQSMMLRRIWSFNWCYHLLRDIFWIFCAVCNLVDFFFFLRREELSIVLLIYILERERSILSSLTSSPRAGPFLGISLNNFGFDGKGF
jgi:hypothetical protein